MHQFRAAQAAAADQQREQGAVALLDQGAAVGRVEQLVGLLPELSQLPARVPWRVTPGTRAIAGGGFRREEAVVGHLAGQAADGGEAQVAPKALQLPRSPVQSTEALRSKLLILLSNPFTNVLSCPNSDATPI